MDLISTNTGSTLDKTLRASYQLYFTYQNEQAYVSFGDEKNQTIKLSTSIKYFLNIFSNKTNFSIC